MNVRAIVAWTLYDFANSAFAAVIFATIYAAYYALAVVGNAGGEGDLWWGRVVSVSMGLVALTSPFLGGVADRAGIRRPLLIGFTAAAVAATALMATVEPGMVVWGFVLGVIGNFAYESALVYYNAYLPDLAPPSHQGRVSGWGFAVGYAGSIAACWRPCPSCGPELRGGLLATAALYAVFSLPAFFMLPAAPGGRVPVLRAAREGAAQVVATARRILALPDLRRFLGAYFIYEDGVNTVIAFSGHLRRPDARLPDGAAHRAVHRGADLGPHRGAGLGTTDRRPGAAPGGDDHPLPVDGHRGRRLLRRDPGPVLGARGRGRHRARGGPGGEPRVAWHGWRRRACRPSCSASTRSAARARRSWARSCSGASPTRPAATSGPASWPSARSS